MSKWETRLEPSLERKASSQSRGRRRQASAFCPLCDKGECDPADFHPDRVPKTRLHEKVKDGPQQAMNNPSDHAESEFLSWQHIAAPPQLLATYVEHEHPKDVRNQNPPCPEEAGP